MTTYITFVLDETGSMDHIRSETISGFNAYIEELRKTLKGRTSFSLLKFNSSKMEWFVQNESVKKVEPLTIETYIPGYSTPLWDAVANAIEELDGRIKRKKDPKVILTVLTDGYENASRYHKTEDVKDLIEARKEWGINFVGAGIDVWDVTDAIGVPQASNVTTPATPTGIRSGMKGVALASAGFAGGQSASSSMYGESKTSDEYLEEEEKKKQTSKK